MAAFVRTALFRNLQKQQNNVIFKAFYAKDIVEPPFTMGDPLTWRHKWRPNDYPETEEQKKKAAERYNLPRERYEPYDDDGNGVGDYPKLPFVSTEAKTLFYPYDYPEMRRNFNEPINYYNNVLAEDRCYVNEKLVVPIWAMALQFLTIMGVGWALFVYFEHPSRRFEQKVLEKCYYQPGVKHYSFEPAK